MSEPQPYVHKNPGDLIQSEDWNTLQVRAREEIRIHRHTGEADGAKIPRAGIEDGAIDGSKVDPHAEVALKQLRVWGTLSTRTGVRAHPGVDLTLHTEGEPRLTIARDGNIGIGVAEPKVKLHIDGAVRGAEPSGLLQISTPSGSLQIGAGSEKYAQYVTDRTMHYFNKELVVDGGRISAFGGDVHLCVADKPRLTAGSEKTRVSTDYGFIDLGPRNPYGCHFKTNKGMYHFDKSVMVGAGKIGAWATDLQLCISSDTKMTIYSDDGAIRGASEQGSLRLRTDVGYLNLGPKSAAHCHFETDRDAYLFNKPLLVTGGRIGANVSALHLCVDGEEQLVVRADGTVRGGGENGSLRVLTSLGYLNLGPKREKLHCHFDTDMPKFHFNKPLEVSGGEVGSWKSDLKLCVNGDPKLTVYSDGTVRGGSSSGTLRIKSAHGWLNLGPNSVAHCHINTDRGAYLFNKELQVTGGRIGSNASSLRLCVNGEEKLVVREDGTVRGAGTGGSLRIKSDHGYLNIGPRSKWHSHFDTDLSSFWFNTQIEVKGGRFGSRESDLHLCVNRDPKVVIDDEGRVFYHTLGRRAKNLARSAKDIQFATARHWLLNLIPVRYTKDGTNYYGISRDHPTFPAEFAVGDDGVDYDGIVALLVGMMREIAPRVEAAYGLGAKNVLY